jgi:hypothetical protein
MIHLSFRRNFPESNSAAGMMLICSIMPEVGGEEPLDAPVQVRPPASPMEVTFVKRSTSAS